MNSFRVSKWNAGVFNDILLTVLWKLRTALTYAVRTPAPSVFPLEAPRVLPAPQHQHMENVGPQATRNQSLHFNKTPRRSTCTFKFEQNWHHDERTDLLHSFFRKILGTDFISLVVCFLFWISFVHLWFFIYFSIQSFRLIGIRGICGILLYPKLCILYLICDLAALCW